MLSTSKRRTGRNPSGSPTTAVASPTMTPPEDPTRGGTATLKRSCTTPSLRSSVERRSKSRGEGKAKEHRPDRPEPRNVGSPLQDSPSHDVADPLNRSTKASPTQAFRVLPGRFSAPPTPRRHTPRAPKRTPRLSPRGSLHGNARLQPGRDSLDIRRLPMWDGEDRRRRTLTLGEDGPVQQHSGSLQNLEGTEVLSERAVPARPLMRTASASLMTTCRSNNHVVNSDSHMDAGNVSEPGFQDPGDSSPTGMVAAPATPPAPRGCPVGTPDGSPALMSPAGGETIVGESESQTAVQSSTSLSGATTPTDSGDVPMNRHRDAKPAGHGDAAMDSRIMKLIGRRSVLCHGSVYPDMQAPKRHRQQRCPLTRAVPPALTPQGSPGSPPKPGAQDNNGFESAPAGVDISRSLAGVALAEANRRTSNQPPNDSSPQATSSHTNPSHTKATGNTPRIASTVPGCPYDNSNAEADRRGAASQPLQECPNFGAGHHGSGGTFLPLPEDEDESPTHGSSVSVSQAGRPGLQEDESPTDGSNVSVSHGTRPGIQEVTGEIDVAAELQADLAAAGIDGTNNAIIWPGRPIPGKTEAPPVQEKPQLSPHNPQPQQMPLNPPPPPHMPPHNTQLLQPTAPIQPACVGTSWSRGAQLDRSYMAAVNGIVGVALGSPSASSSMLLTNEVGSLVMPNTWRYVPPPQQLLPPQPAQAPLGPLPDSAKNSSSTSSNARSASTRAPSDDDSAQGKTQAQTGYRDSEECTGDVTPNKDMKTEFDDADFIVDAQSKCNLLGELFESFAAKGIKVETLLGEEQRANRALHVTMEVLQRQNVCLQQQLAWTSQSWQYSNACWQDVALAPTNDAASTNGCGCSTETALQ